MKNLILNSIQSIEGDAPLAVQLAPFGEFDGVLNKTDGTKPQATSLRPKPKNFTRR